MLIKLIKYNLYTAKSRYFMLMSINLGMMLLSISLKVFGSDTINNFMISMSVFVSVVTVIISFIFILMEVFGKICGNESIFIFTLPAKTKQIYFSHLVSSLLWILFMIAFFILFWMIWVLLLFSPMLKTLVFAQISAVIQSFYFAKMLLFLGIVAIYYLCIILLCAAIVNLPTFKNKNLGMATGVISWIVISQLSGLILLLGLMVYFVINGGSLSNVFMNDPANLNYIVDSITIVFGVGMSVLSLIYYFLGTRVIANHRSL